MVAVDQLILARVRTRHVLCVSIEALPQTAAVVGASRANSRHLLASIFAIKDGPAGQQHG